MGVSVVRILHAEPWTITLSVIGGVVEGETDRALGSSKNVLTEKTVVYSQQLSWQLVALCWVLTAAVDDLIKNETCSAFRLNEL